MDLDKPLPPESKTLTLHIHQLWVVKETWSVFSEKKGSGGATALPSSHGGAHPTSHVKATYVCRRVLNQCDVRCVLSIPLCIDLASTQQTGSRGGEGKYFQTKTYK